MEFERDLIRERVIAGGQRGKGPNFGQRRAGARLQLWKRPEGHGSTHWGIQNSFVVDPTVVEPD